MTQVFIAAVSTTKFQMNEEDLQFYRDEKAREIQQVRLAMEHLHDFDQLHKKQRPLANHALFWKNLLILSKILGYQSDFAIIDQLRIPQSILTQQLWSMNQLFTIKHYYPRTPIGCWENVADRYYILMEGIVEKEVLRSSISKFQTDSIQFNGRMNTASKFKKNNKKRFARTDEQIPICLNSKRSEGRNSQLGNSHYRSVTDVQILEVNCSSWKRYVSDFKRLQEEFLMNFIRKKLNLSLNFDRKTQQSEESEKNMDPFYSIVTLQRKSILKFNKSQIFLLYMGQMLLTTPYYKIEISRGCVLNPAISDIFIYSFNDQKSVQGTAVAKNLATIIKISIDKLQEYFRDTFQEKGPFVQLLRGLQTNRRSKKQQQKLSQLSQAESLVSLRSSCLMKKINRQSSQQALRTITQSPSKLHQTAMPQISQKLKQRQKIIGLKCIQNLVQKTAKAAQLKHIQYLKRAHLQQNPHSKHYQQENLQLPEYLFKDCMRKIQVKNEILKQAVKLQKEKYRNEMSHKQLILGGDCTHETLSKIRSLPSTDGSIFIKKRIKDIYVRTEGCEEMLNLATSSQRPTAGGYSQEKSQVRKTVRAGQQFRELSDKQLYSGLFKWYSGGLGVMKKVQTGKIRRIKMK